MKNIKNILFLLFFCAGIALSQQNPNGFTCELPTGAPPINQLVIGGQYKPESIDKYTNDPNAVFRILIVFVQFDLDPGPDVNYWPVNGEPNYMGNIISQDRINNSNWWDAYSESNATLSDFWMEASRGHFHVVGKSVNVVLPQEYSYYQQFGLSGIEKINDDIYAQLQSDPTIYWPDFDLWTKSGNSFVYAPDGKIDMIYKVHRSHSPFMGMPAGGIAQLYNSYSQGVNYKIYDNGAGTVKYINGGFGEEGSGITMTPGHGYDESDPLYFRYAPFKKNGVVSFSEHEHGHYIFGAGHQKYGKMMGAGADYGLDEFLSPYESVRLGYMTTKPVVFNTTNTIDDYSSRDNNSQGQVLEVPISGEGQFFLIANRQQVSNYDRIMWGDKAHGDPYKQDIGDLGKGVYIYHAFPGTSGYPFLIAIDNECADGLFDWVQDGFRHPDWSCDQEVDYFKRNNVSYYLNDNGGDGLLSVHDGKSLDNWFGLGKFNGCQGNIGQDRIETNLIADQPQNYSNPAPYEVWTSMENKGDRWDGWSIGYNEVFSPYSSPSTVDWNNSSWGVFIYLESMNGTQANFKIYKEGVNGITEDQILELTPPSKPMNLKVEHCYTQPGTSYMYNKLTWNHNLEPDMKREVSPGVYVKKYNIYKVTSPNVNDLPNENNYTLLATVDIDASSVPSYVDLSEPSGCHSYPDASCPPTCWTLHATRYRVQAVDVHNTPSVKSDFASAFSFTISNIGGTESGDNPIKYINSAPTEYSLKQNFPNPFNPSTSIKFELPQNTFVTLIIYNSIGEEVARLVDNEYKNAGRYSLNFDGSNLASGIYFYSIDAGSFKDVKKMVLIK